MTHYTLDRLHLGCGESLATYYRQANPLKNEQKRSKKKAKKDKRVRATGQTRES